MSDAVLLQGDCLEVLKELPDNSLDSLVTDPPAGIGFMGKEWDSDKGGRDGWIKWMTEVIASPQGRFPANLVLTEGEATEALDEQAEQDVSRFFYCAKISTSERNAGLEGMEPKQMGRNQSSLDGGKMLTGSGNPRSNERLNHHPTVKPKKLMSYLIRMITPPGGVVLDPFMGSGSTGIAAKECGFDFIGIEKESEYFQIAEQRINSSKKETA